jgi:hypothetical protein
MLSVTGKERKSHQDYNTEFKAVAELQVQIPGMLPLTVCDLEACYKFKFHGNGSAGVRKCSCVHPKLGTIPVTL